MVSPTKAPNHEIGSAKNLSHPQQHQQREDQPKVPSASVSSPNQSHPQDLTTLSNVTIADKFKKYPGYIHPYTTYIHDGLKFVGGFGSVFKVMDGAGVFAIKAQKAGVSIERDRQIRSEARFLKRAITSACVSNGCQRDIKPENVLVSGTASQMIVKLADFGLVGYMKDGRKLRLDAITIGKELIVNLTDKEDRRLSAEEVIGHPFLCNMVSATVQQEKIQEEDNAKEPKVVIVEEKTKRPRESSEENPKMTEKPKQDGSSTDARKFKNRKQSSDIKRPEQDRTTAIQKEGLIAEPTPKHRLDVDIREMEEKEVKKPKLTPDPARSTKTIRSISASANSVKDSIPHPHPHLSPS
ncbi:hypothetical protein KI688_000217 [Linnemannia hyalina]|uniref:Protein kinase domain-containing protein n=1 Tax=Linnemannia hyalina TaxID=64524 RepID=A0A9P8BYK1_9FUNG|nr:hypothetical protein KI688_000217 [Linnemannia hyalina]